METPVQDSLELVFRAGFQRGLTIWLTLFSLLCIVLAMIAPRWGEPGGHQLWLLLFVHAVLFLFLVGLCTLPWCQGGASRYIREHHPTIGKKLGAPGLFTRNSLVTIPFMVGAYDDGQDSYLQLIKRRYRRLGLLQLWLFALFLLPVLVAMIQKFVLLFIAPLLGD